MSQGDNWGLDLGIMSAAKLSQVDNLVLMMVEMMEDGKVGKWVHMLAERKVG